MTVSQRLEAPLGNTIDWDDDISITDVPKEQFAAVTGNTAPAAGSTTRNITVSLLPAEWAPGGTNSVNSGIFVRQSGETAVCVKVLDTNGKEIGSNTSNYPS